LRKNAIATLRQYSRARVARSLSAHSDLLVGNAEIKGASES
jgi:hypothetical protein